MTMLITSIGHLNIQVKYFHNPQEYFFVFNIISWMSLASITYVDHQNTRVDYKNIYFVRIFRLSTLTTRTRDIRPSMIERRFDRLFNKNTPLTSDGSQKRPFIYSTINYYTIIIIFLI